MIYTLLLCNLQSCDIDDEKNEWVLFCARLDALGPLWDLIDACHNAALGNPTVQQSDGTEVKLTLGQFKSQAEELMKVDSMLCEGLKVKGIDGMLKINNDKWMNKSNKDQRRYALAKSGRYLVCFMFGECAGFDCNRHPINLDVSSLFHLDHDGTLKLGARTPSQIACSHGMRALVAEVKEKKCIMTCDKCHDKGDGNRKHYHPAAYKNLPIVRYKPAVSYRSPQNVVFNNDGKDPIAALSFVFFLLDSQARNVTSKSHWGTMRTLLLAYFDLVADGMVKYDGTYYDNVGTGSRMRLFNELLPEIISFLCGRCADLTCKDGDLRNKSPMSTARVWDHDKKKSGSITEIGNTFHMLNELLSWTVPLCCVSDAIRTRNQQNGCARRCYAMDGCSCTKSSNPFPTKVGIKNTKNK